MSISSKTDQLLRLKDICLPTGHVLPIGRGAFQAGVRRGDFPKPIRLGKGKFWRLSELQQLIRDGAPFSGQRSGPRIAVAAEKTMAEA